MSQGTGPSGGDEPIPFMQQLLDNPIVLLLIGVLMPTLLYTVWGVMEVLSVPMGQ